MKDYQERIHKETVVMDYFMVQSQDLSGGTTENHDGVVTSSACGKL
jgi:hypothetical protein